MLSGNSIGLNDNVWGQMGVIRIAGICGCTSDPPAESEYAVEPVGVETVNPSACTVVRWCSSPSNQPYDPKAGSSLTKELQERDKRARSSIDHQVIEHLELFHGSSAEAHDLLVPSFHDGIALALSIAPWRAFQSLPSALVNLAHKNLPAGLLDRFARLPFCACLGRFLGCDGAVNSACKPHPEIDTNAVIDDFVHCRLIFGEIEVGQEAERSKGERQNRWNDPLAEE